MKIRFHSFSQSTALAFTIVELMIVIIVIGVLASVVVVGYNGVLNNSRETAMKSDLTQTYAKLKSYVNSNDTYPSELGGNAVQSEGVNLDYGVNAEGSNFCLDASYSGVSKVFSVDKTGTIKEGYCDAIYAPSSCFAYSVTTIYSGTTMLKITDYYDYQGNSSSNSACPRDVMIPKGIEGKVVTTIGSRAFQSNSLTSVTIPSSVTSIGDYVFSGNKLTSVTIPSSVTSIGHYAFYGNSLTSVTIPSSVTSIRSSAFSDNSLTSVTIPSSVTFIGSYAFQSNNLTSVTIPSSVTSIGSGAFRSNSLTSVTIPSSVTSIGGSAFQSNNLTSVTIPSSVTSIGTNAFQYNPYFSSTTITCAIPTGTTFSGTGCASFTYY